LKNLEESKKQRETQNRKKTGRENLSSLSSQKDRQEGDDLTNLPVAGSRKEDNRGEKETPNFKSPFLNTSKRDSNGVRYGADPLQAVWKREMELGRVISGKFVRNGFRKLWVTVRGTHLEAAAGFN